MKALIKFSVRNSFHDVAKSYIAKYEISDLATEGEKDLIRKGLMLHCQAAMRERKSSVGTMAIK